MTALHNVLKKERRALNQDDPQGAREDLDKAEREIHEKGLIGVLRELHDELDAAPAEPLDWSSDLKPRAYLPDNSECSPEKSLGRSSRTPMRDLFGDSIAGFGEILSRAQNDVL